jgi:hypothetical protein
VCVAYGAGGQWGAWGWWGWRSGWDDRVGVAAVVGEMAGQPGDGAAKAEVASA